MPALLLLTAGPVRPAAAQQFSTADSIVESGIRRGIYPGAVLVVGRRDGLLHAHGFGHLTWGPSTPVPSPDSTRWDLASLTKVVATTGAVMRLVEQGRVDLDAPVRHYLPRFDGADRDQVTVRLLLEHRSGLPSYVPFFKQTAVRDTGIALLYHTPLRHPPGVVTEYSDLNFLLLGLLVEVVSGVPLDQFAEREVLLPAGMAHTGFRPGLAQRDHTAPTGRWHGRPVCCVVNDQNAALFGGVAGHAGLFATAQDLARFAQLWLGLGSLSGRVVFQASTVRDFLKPAGDWLQGWERANPDHHLDSAFGQLLSDQAYGHTGWTGTLLWIDPGRDLFMVFLTNRSYDPRVPDSIRALRGVRGALADAAVRAAAGP